MKKLNTLLITSTLLLGASGVQAKLSDSDIASGVQVAFDLRHWNTNYNNHPGKYGKQYNLSSKIFFLKRKIKKTDQRVLDALASRKHLVYLVGVHQYKADEARKKVEHLEIVGSTESEMQLASDLLYADVYQLDRTTAKKNKLLKKLSKLVTDVHSFRVTLDKLNIKLKKMQARDGVMNMRTRKLEKK